MYVLNICKVFTETNKEQGQGTSEAGTIKRISEIINNLYQ